MRKNPLWLIFAALVLGVSLGQSQKIPRPSITLTVTPGNATTTPFSYTSRVDTDGAKLMRHWIEVEWIDRAGKKKTFKVKDANSPLLEGEWIATSNQMCKNETHCTFWGCETVYCPMGDKLSSISWNGYRTSAGTLHSIGGYAPGIYTFTAQATLYYKVRTGHVEETRYINVEDKKTVTSIYAGTTSAQAMRDLFYYAQRVWMGKPMGEFSGQIDGPYSPNRDTVGRPWIGGILLGLQKDGALWDYFQKYGLRGYLANNGSLENYPKECEGICTTYEAYDPDWLLGKKSDDPYVRAQLEAFLSNFIMDLVGYPPGGWYQYRSLSRGFSLGEYDPKGFIMFQTPGRDYLFFSRTGLFQDGERILVIELPPGFVQIMRSVMNWGEMKRRLKECKPGSKDC